MDVENTWILWQEKFFFVSLGFNFPSLFLSVGPLIYLEGRGWKKGGGWGTTPATEFTLLWNMKICCNIQVIIYQFLVCSIVLILFLLFYFLVTLRVLTSDKPDPVGPRGGVTYFAAWHSGIRENHHTREEWILGCLWH